MCPFLFDKKGEKSIIYEQILKLNFYQYRCRYPALVLVLIHVVFP